MASATVPPRPRIISPEEIEQHNSANGKKSFWAVIDGYVVDATAFLDTHPGGLKKLLSANSANIGATGHKFGFSFSKGRNAHFGHTARRFENGIQKFLNCKKAGNSWAVHGLVLLCRLLEPTEPVSVARVVRGCRRLWRDHTT